MQDIASGGRTQWDWQMKVFRCLRDGQEDITASTLGEFSALVELTDSERAEMLAEYNTSEVADGTTGP